MHEFDDPYLRNTLQQLGGHTGDEAAAYADLQQRVRAVKRRRATVASGGLLAVCVAGLAFAGLRGGTNESVTPATTGVTARPTVEQSVESTEHPSTTEEPSSTSAPGTTSTESSVAPSTSAPSTAEPSTAPSLVTDTSTVPAIETGAGTAPGGAPPSLPDGSSPPATGAPADNQTIPAAHGTLTVELRDGRLAIVDHTVDGGYAYSVERDDGTRIRVRFRNGDDRSQIDVSVVGGRIAGHATEQTSGGPAGPAPTNPTDPNPPSSPPSTVTPTTDDHGGGSGDGSGGSSHGGGSGSGASGGGSDDGSGNG